MNTVKLFSIVSLLALGMICLAGCKTGEPMPDDQPFGIYQPHPNPSHYGDHWTAPPTREGSAGMPESGPNKMNDQLNTGMDYPDY